MAGRTETATLGGGCFWCLDAVYREIDGVVEVVSGYAGGKRPDPTYELVSTGNTGHAEVVRVTFDPDVISYRDILDIFWSIHDPTTLNRQGADVGTQYRSIILYNDDTQKAEAEASRDAAQSLWSNPIVTEILALDAFYRAEDYHQDYFAKHPENAYCAIVINPKLEKLRKKHADRLKVHAS